MNKITQYPALDNYNPAQLQAWIVQQVEYALLKEAYLTPKPGLVDAANNGAHQDMDLALFQVSAAAICQSLHRCFAVGLTSAELPVEQILTKIRQAGLICEQAMLQATHGVNTHKGAVFAFALLCAAAGRLTAQRTTLTAKALCQQVALFCRGLVARELRSDMTATTAGERLFVQYGLTGARGEAESGFNTVITLALPCYQYWIAQGVDQEQALLYTLLHLMAENSDSNIVARGGMDGLIFTQNYARQLLQHLDVNRCHFPAMQQLLQQFDQELIARNLSPGGSADLLAVTYFLAHLPPE